MDFIDLRSDTVTQPTPEMRQAMANAAVGDDVYGEDPTINELQELAASMLGKEAALFVPSGTMANLTALLTHGQRGDEFIVGNRAHIFLFEAGGASALGGLHSRQLNNQPDGSLDLDEIRRSIRSNDAHEPRTRLIALENTHNRCGGTYQTPDYIKKISEFAHQRGLLLHLDGARIFNAAVACNVPAKDLAAGADSVSFCLSKGLCAPVGSLLCGTREFIHRAHHIRKQLGGGMRQAGVLAAAGLVSLRSMVGRLHEDHARARSLAEGLRNVPGLTVDFGERSTNMVFLKLSDKVNKTDDQILSRLKEFGILIGDVGERYFRLVVHYWISDGDVNKVVNAFAQILGT